MNTYYPERRKISVTLELEVYDDFDPVSIDWFELLELSGGETVEASILETETYEECDTDQLSPMYLYGPLMSW